MAVIYRSANVLLIDKHGNFLLQLRDDKPEIFYPNMVGLFGGGIEAGETPLQAAIRELEEETELVFKADELKFLGEVRYYDQQNKGYIETHVFIAKNIDPKKIVVHEGQGVYVIKPTEKLKQHPLIRDARQALLRYSKKTKG